MHTVGLLKEAVEAARRLGYEVRLDWLGGDGGGHCLVRGRKWLVLDLAQPPEEQFDVVAEALGPEVDEIRDTISADLADQLTGLRVA
jgi:hypothetical protein